MQKLLFILLLSFTSTAFCQLTAPAILDTTKVGMYLSGEQKVTLANKINRLTLRNAIGDSLINVQRQQIWDLNALYRIADREREAISSQLKETHKQIEFLQQTINDYKPNFFDKHKGEIGFILGIIGGIVIVKLIK